MIVKWVVGTLVAPVIGHTPHFNSLPRGREDQTEPIEFRMTNPGESELAMAFRLLTVSALHSAASSLVIAVRVTPSLISFSRTILDISSSVTNFDSNIPSSS